MSQTLRILTVLGLLLIAATYATATYAAATLKLEDFTLRGDLGGAHVSDLHQQRLAQANEQLGDALAEDARFTLVEDDHDAELILVPWVYRVSALVLSLHGELRDANTGDVVSRRAVDFRGDNDTGWQRAVSALLRDWP